MDKQPKVSVIVPCYNVGKYLDRCVDSLLDTDWTNKELIFVDDGSTDGTSEALDRHAARDGRITVVHKPNGGVSSARNAGLDAASGEYLMFCDPDDCVERDFMSTAVEAIAAGGYDMVLFGFNTDWTGRFEPALPVEDYDLRTNREILDVFFPRLFGLGLEQLDNWLRGGVLMPLKETGQIWRWIYRKALVDDNGIRFRPVKVGEDMVFNAECLLAAASMKSIRDCLYNYFPRKDGLMYSNIKGLDSLRNKLDMISERERVGRLYEASTGREALPLYGGSCVMSCFELAMLLSRTRAGYKTLHGYLTLPVVRESVRRSRLRAGNKKALLPHLLLKMRAGRALYAMFWLVDRLGLKISY